MYRYSEFDKAFLAERNAQFRAQVERRIDGSLTEADVDFESLAVDGVVESTTGGFRFPDGSLQSTAAVSSGTIVEVPVGGMILKRSNITSNGFSYTGLRLTATQASAGWQTRPPSDSPSYGHAAVGLGSVGASGSLFVVGGLDLSGPVANLQAYDLAAGSWSVLAPMPGGERGDLAAAATRIGPTHYLFVAGGRDGNDVALDRLEEYTVETGSWDSRAGMNHPRYGLVLVLDSNNGGLYAIGGREPIPASSFDTPVNYVERYDQDSDTWTVLTPMPTARAYAAAGFVGGKIYVAGGDVLLTASVSSPGAEPTDAVEVYDIATDSWSSLTPLPEPRYGAGGAVLQGGLYVAGGRGPASVEAQEVFRLTPAGLWTQSVPLVPERFYTSLVTVGGSLWSYGGLKLGPFTVFDDLQELLPGEVVLYVHQRN